MSSDKENSADAVDETTAVVTVPEEDPQKELPCTLYVGNLDKAVTDVFLFSLFNNMHPVKSCKIRNEQSGESLYAFVEFYDHAAALAVLSSMNERQCYDKKLKLNWATTKSPASHYSNPKFQAGGFQIFVGDLPEGLSADELKREFEQFGEIVNCRIVKDTYTFKSKGYGFISFTRHRDAQRAIESMNGVWLGTRSIKTNWAAKTLTEEDHGRDKIYRKPQSRLLFTDVFNQSSPSNRTVYCGRIEVGLTEGLMRDIFNRFGIIDQVRIHNDKGFAFVKFASKESAANAIIAVHESIINGYRVKCSWGKEQDGNGNGRAHAFDLPPQSVPYGTEHHHAPQQPQGYGPAPVQFDNGNQLPAYNNNWQHQQTGYYYWYPPPPAPVNNLVPPNQMFQEQFQYGMPQQVYPNEDSSGYLQPHPLAHQNTGEVQLQIPHVWEAPGSGQGRSAPRRPSQHSFSGTRRTMGGVGNMERFKEVTAQPTNDSNKSDEDRSDSKDNSGDNK